MTPASVTQTTPLTPVAPVTPATQTVRTRGVAPRPAASGIDLLETLVGAPLDETRVHRAVPTDPSATQTVTVRRPRLAETAVRQLAPLRALGDALPEHAERTGLAARAPRSVSEALADPTWLTYLGILLGALIATFVVGFLLLMH